MAAIQNIFVGTDFWIFLCGFFFYGGGICGEPLLKATFAGA